MPSKFASNFTEKRDLTKNWTNAMQEAPYRGRIDIINNKARYNQIYAKYHQMTFRSVPTNPYLESLVKRNWCKFRRLCLDSMSVVILSNCLFYWSPLWHRPVFCAHDWIFWLDFFSQIHHQKSRSIICSQKNFPVKLWLFIVYISVSNQCLTENFNQFKIIWWHIYCLLLVILFLIDFANILIFIMITPVVSC